MSGRKSVRGYQEDCDHKRRTCAEVGCMEDEGVRLRVLQANMDLRAEVRALRRERRALRKAMRNVLGLVTSLFPSSARDHAAAREARLVLMKALAPKARRRKA